VSESGDTGEAVGRGAGGLVGASGEPLVWLLTRWALGEVAAEPVMVDALRSARLCQLLGAGQEPVPGMGAVPVLSAGSVGKLAEAIDGGLLPGGTRAVLYDPENWPFTPPAEQRDPAAATARAWQLAHAHRLRLIVAPALSLTNVLAPGKAPRWQRFLDLGLAAALAQSADVIELQAQSLERDTTSYVSFVEAAAAQARAANPRVSVLAGLSANPPGAPVSISDLATAVRATLSLVDGYWLNIPRPGKHCPTCNPPQPGLARELLHAAL
jgi:hypothetical protein